MCALLPGHTGSSCAAAKLRASSSVLAVNNTLMTCIGGQNVLRSAPSIRIRLSQATTAAVTPMRCMWHVCRRSCVSAGKEEIATSHNMQLHCTGRARKACWRLPVSANERELHGRQKHAAHARPRPSRFKGQLRAPTSQQPARDLWLIVA